jgi:hypothetical protein
MAALSEDQPGGITEIADIREGLVLSQAHPVHGVAQDRPTSTSNKRKSQLDHTSDGAPVSKAARTNPQLWENKIFSCLVVSPKGRIISTFCTITELLESERDAIKAHQSLYVQGNILHRDISSNNILITDPKTADGFKGMLIDLDMAEVRDSGPSGARHRTGTVQFMAIEVLLGINHTYRHDLESFFYVLLWMCARQAWTNGLGEEQKRPQYSLLNKWETGSFKDVAEAKEGQMAVSGLERIMGEFPQALDVVKPLCVRMRNILFPFDQDTRMIIGTPAGDPDQLYKPIIAAFDDAISEL